ncbi:MAG TPA: FAD:protein FMN transferase, partial [Anaerolineae bacterium]|nr:FAD:protein FMN transferase [Anaerolineae bacterium]
DVMLDFGGIAKGLIAQQVVQFLQQWGPCLVDAGGDLVAGDPPQGQPGWATGITAPLENGVAIRPNLARLWLHNGALMTSGVDYRHWPTTMGEQHHIIDPRVGVSAETDLLTVTVLAADACQAEAWATATLVAGFEHGYAQLLTHNIAAMLVTRAKEIHITPTFEPYLQLESSLVR